MYEFSFPAACTEQLHVDFRQRRWKDCLRELVRYLVDSLLFGPAVQFLGAAIPVGNDVGHVADEDGVVREVEEAGLLVQYLFGLLALNGDTGNMGDLLYEIMLLWSGATRFAIVDRECP